MGNFQSENLTIQIFKNCLNSFETLKVKSFLLSRVALRLNNICFLLLSDCNDFPIHVFQHHQELLYVYHIDYIHFEQCAYDRQVDNETIKHLKIKTLKKKKKKKKKKS